MPTIDLDKTKKLRQFLADTDEGQSALLEFRAAIENLRKSAGSQVNNAEFGLVLRGLVNGLKLDTDAMPQGIADLSDLPDRMVAGDFMVRAAE